MADPELDEPARYEVFIAPLAERQIDAIYAYLAGVLLVPETAIEIVDAIEEGILSLEVMPNRGALRRTGTYAGQYRQIFAGRFVILYRVDDAARTVMVVAVKHTLQDF